MLGASACAQAIKLHHALDLLETQTLESFNLYLKEIFKQASKKQSKGVIKLASKQEFNFMFMQSNELLAKNHEHPKLEMLSKIIKEEFNKEDKKPRIIIFTQFRETARKISENLNLIKGVKSETFVGQALKNGTGLSQKKQKEIIEKFKKSEINVLVATSIAEEGLDIPEVNAVIFYEPIPSAIRSIQRAGRTARLTKGKLIILITKNTKDESFFYISRAREKRMEIAIEGIKKDLNAGIKFELEEQKKL
jgi:Fanconi anemia group M protein